MKTFIQQMSAIALLLITLLSFDVNAQSCPPSTYEACFDIELYQGNGFTVNCDVEICIEQNYICGLPSAPTLCALTNRTCRTLAFPVWPASPIRQICTQDIASIAFPPACSTYVSKVTVKRVSTGETLTITGTDAYNFGIILHGGTPAPPSLTSVYMGSFRYGCNGVLLGSPLPVFFSPASVGMGHTVPWMQF
jgi:hypothetical protein